MSLEHEGSLISFPAVLETSYMLSVSLSEWIFDERASQLSLKVTYTVQAGGKIASYGITV